MTKHDVIGRKMPKGSRASTEPPRRYDLQLVENEDVGGYTVLCPALPGLVTQGDTVEECKAQARCAVRSHLSAMRNLKMAIPPSDADDPDKIQALEAKSRSRHLTLTHPDKPGRLVTFPVQNKNLKPETLKALLSHVGMTREELEKLL